MPILKAEQTIHFQQILFDRVAEADKLVIHNKIN